MIGRKKNTEDVIETPARGRDQAQGSLLSRSLTGNRPGKRVGIDIGSTSVRVVQVSGTNSTGMPQITAYASERLPSGAVSGGKLAEPALVGIALKEALKKAKVSGYGAIVGLGTPDVALSQVLMPAAVDPAKYANILMLEGKQISPRIPLIDALLAFSPLEAELDDPTQVLLSVSAVLRDDARDVLKACRIAKVTPRALDLSGAAAFRALTAFPYGSRDTVATLVDVGATTTTVVTRAGLGVRSLRVLEAGSDQITRALAGALNVPIAAAEDVKKSLRVGEMPTQHSAAAAAVAAQFGQTSDADYGSLEESTTTDAAEDPSVVAQRTVTASADQLIEQIAEAIDSDTAMFTEGTSSVLLCGRGSLLTGLASRLQRRTGVPASTVRPYIAVKDTGHVDGLLEEGSANPELLLDAVTATGLATWNGGS